MSSHAPRQLIPLYALGALLEPETFAVDAHLDSCPVCLEELGQYLSVVASLSTDRAAPRHVWERIVASIEAESAPIDHTAEVIDIGSSQHAPPRRAVNRLLPISAAAAVLLGIVVGSPFSSERTRTEVIVASAQRAAAQPEAYVGDFLVDGMSLGEVILTDTGEGYLIPTDRLPSLHRSRTYQLWVITVDESVISGGVLGSDPRPAPFTWDGPVAGFALTREATGGATVSAGDVVAVATER
ncbi:MAG: anti-sigma factor [Acidimicrobiia bacterium]|jgi:hypothetical protein